MSSSSERAILAVSDELALVSVVVPFSSPLISIKSLGNPVTPPLAVG
jgi:hypothetical protein